VPRIQPSMLAVASFVRGTSCHHGMILSGLGLEPQARSLSSPMPAPLSYVGRFAPSPTGPLHLGSLVAAMAASLDARAHGGRLRLRIDDVDTTRAIAGAEHRIVQSLAAHGVHWDGVVEKTTDHSQRHAQAFDQLRARGLVYRCTCSRATILAMNTLHGRPHERGAELYYPGHCRPDWGETAIAEHQATGHQATERPDLTDPDPSGGALLLPWAWRVRVAPGFESFADRAAGTVQEDVASSIGDFVLRRADGAWAYHLAIVVDDAADGVTDIVRGDDLLGTTARQRYLQRLLGLSLPRTLHIPVVRTPSGEKLSKQSKAPALDDQNPLDALIAAAKHLDLGDPPDMLASPRTGAQTRAPTRAPLSARIETFWSWATTAWARRWCLP